MSRFLLTLTIFLAVGALVAGTPSPLSGFGLGYTLTADGHGSGGGPDSGPSDGAGQDGSDDGPNHDLDDDHGMDVNEPPEDSDFLLMPAVLT